VLLTVEQIPRALLMLAAGTMMAAPAFLCPFLRAMMARG